MWVDGAAFLAICAFVLPFYGLLALVLIAGLSWLSELVVAGSGHTIGFALTWALGILGVPLFVGGFIDLMSKRRDI